MEIDINQKPISIGDKYAIFINGVQEYFASLKIFTLLTEIFLFKGKETEPLMVINKELTSLNPLFTIAIGNVDALKYTTISFWKSQFQCISGDDTYNIYSNKGRKYSIYKNDVQIAYWEHKRVSWFDGDNYKLFADSDCNKELMIAFCLIMDNYENNDRDKGTFNIDLGNIGWGLKKFNLNWKPKEY